MFRNCRMFTTILRSFSYNSLNIKQTLLSKPIDTKIYVQGWVQAVRKHKDVLFVDVNDGSCLEHLQIVIQSQKDKLPTFHCPMQVYGTVVKSLHKGQEIELIADSWKMFGDIGDSYPFINHQKHPQEYVRQYPHMRQRTKSFSSILQIQEDALVAAFKFFKEKGFRFVRAPVITQNDCEGAGEVFNVESKHELNKDIQNEAGESANDSLTNLHSELIPRQQTDKSEHFFGAPSYLTVSAQLHLESMAHGIARVFTLGNTFRAESSKSKLHASEFLMIEAEVAFIDKVEDLMEIAESCIKKVVESVTETCSSEVRLVTQDRKNHEKYMQDLLTKDFVRMSYDEAMGILLENKDKIKVPIQHGEDFSAEHKQFLVRHCSNVPVFVSMFPSAIKPFYMKSFENYAYCFDLFAAYGGEICGGSLREDGYEKLKEKLLSRNIQNLSWYLDLRKYGSVPHGGFGIGFDRLLQSMLGISHIRDIIPFPRRRNDCKC